MSRIHLNEISTLPPETTSKDICRKALTDLKEELFYLQNKLYADGRYSVLIVLQGLDTSGKDGTIRNAFTSMNPQGVRVTSFKKPTELELKHDFLWRIYPHFPEKGIIRVFNRSHYEDILVPRAEGLVSPEIIRHRIKMINALEQHLQLNNTVILKYYLHISPEEQLERLEERKNIPHKKWKYNKADDLIPGKWDDYRGAFDLVLNECNEVPWHIIPADKRWYRNYEAARILKETLGKMKLKFPS